MPYKLTWIEPKKNPKLKSFEKLPEGYEESKFSLGYKKATKKMDVENIKALKDEPFEYHFCDGWNRFAKEQEGCGWVEGLPSSYKMNTIQPLAGRQGEVYHCAKCGVEVGFSGAIS